MFVVSTWFGTLVRVQAMGLARSNQNERYWAVHCLAKEDVETVDGGILFWGMILEQMSYITEPTAADELRAYEQLWRRPWSSTVAPADLPMDAEDTIQFMNRLPPRVMTREELEAGLCCEKTEAPSA